MGNNFEEWLLLIMEAKSQGISKEEISAFLKQTVCIESEKIV